MQKKEIKYEKIADADARTERKQGLSSRNREFSVLFNVCFCLCCCCFFVSLFFSLFRGKAMELVVNGVREVSLSLS